MHGALNTHVPLIRSYETECVNGQVVREVGKTIG
jgi:hypothetical protein